MTILEAAAAIRARKISASELTFDCLARIARHNARLKAFITVIEDNARLRAKTADEELARGIDRGPLHGIPVAVKDVFSTCGIATTAGSKVFADYVPERDCAVVERLAQAGAVLVGKTNMHELAYGITSSNPHYGAVRNPWDQERIPGGSSGGSAAAVACGMALAAMGSDTGGSIRIPAAFCGIVGLKPTFGRVSRYGVLPLDFSLDHMGPLALKVRDAGAVLNAIAGYDPRDDTSSRHKIGEYIAGPRPSIHGIRLGLPENFYFDAVDPAVGEAVRDAARAASELGAEVVAVTVPDMGALNAIGRVIVQAEASALMEPHLSDRSRFGADVLALLDQGRVLAATDYVNAQRLRRLKRREFAGLWKEVDFLLTPTTPTAAPKLNQATIEVRGETEDVRLASTRLVRAINVLGVPAVSLPCGFDAAGLPIGMQLIGPEFEEARLLRVAAALEDALGFAGRRPAGIE